MEDKIFGEAGLRILIEEFLEGRECSLIAFCDGENVVPLLAARDYKRAYDDDEGPNTGGMGSYAPVPDFTPELREYAVEKILKPTLGALAKNGTPFRGALYAGLMLTENGPKILEFNSRFGDPETQAILPLLRSDLLDPLIRSTATFFEDSALKNLKDVTLDWHNKAAVCVVLASAGYPGHYETGKEIFGLEEAAKSGNVLIFHAGTREEEGRYFTTGGRVLNVVGIGRDHKEARENAYRAVGKIHFEGMRYRRDIAQGL